MKTSQLLQLFSITCVVTLYYTTSTRLYSEKRTAVNRATVKTEWQ